ncbi:Hypothetical protein Minf_2393 [Methylacidiphilum infernorum V4]|uniref:Uncharacterized protein n=1 Tax=Methylacidiphilum infernorum (isolate V4) TaxID=481448 RepID=B3E0X0_METI4|nr:Hypothetical protein Minf_2393 [Methylacidiphilum infernorum V4]
MRRTELHRDRSEPLSWGEKNAAFQQRLIQGQLKREPRDLSFFGRLYKWCFRFQKRAFKPMTWTFREDG